MVEPLTGWRRYVFGVFVLCALRVTWLGWLYAFRSPGVQRHHVESAFFILLVLGLPLCLRAPRTVAGEIPSSAGPSLKAWISWLLILQAAGLLLFGSALSIGLLSDDFVLLEHAQGGGWVSWMARWHFRPLPLFLWELVARVAESPALPLHLINVALHATNAWLVSRLAVRLGLARESALLAGALFLTYPASLEAVVWCSGIQDVLMTTAALIFVLAMGGSWPLPARMAVCGVSLVAGILTKETAVMFPALALVALVSRRSPDLKAHLGLAAGGALVAAGYAAMLFGTGGVPSSYAVPAGLYAFKELLVRPFATLAAPWSGEALEAAPALTGVSVALFAALLVACVPVWTLKSDSLHRVARMVAWIFLSIAPTIPYFVVTADLQGSRYTYLSEAGFAILLADGLAQARRRVGAGAGLAAVGAAIVLLVSAWAVRVHLAAWVDAAYLRDEVMSQASRESEGCRSVALEDIPDSLHGAYVFRLGLPEALRRSRLSVGARLTRSGEADCHITLRSERFGSYTIEGSEWRPLPERP